MGVFCAISTLQATNRLAPHSVMGACNGLLLCDEVIPIMVLQMNYSDIVEAFVNTFPHFV